MHRMNLTTIELWDGSVVVGELISAGCTVVDRIPEIRKGLMLKEVER